MDRLALIASRAPIVRAKGLRFRRHIDSITARKMAGEVAMSPAALPEVVAPGRRIGLLTAVERAGDDATGHSRWSWRCDCGREKAIRTDLVVSGNTMSCGCVGKRRRK